MAPKATAGKGKGGKSKNKGEAPKSLADMTKPEKAKAWGWISTHIKYAPPHLQAAWNKASEPTKQNRMEMNRILGAYIQGCIQKHNGEIESEWDHANFDNYVKKEEITESGVGQNRVSYGRLVVLMGADDAKTAHNNQWYPMEYDKKKKAWFYWYDEKIKNNLARNTSGQEARSTENFESAEAAERAMGELLQDKDESQSEPEGGGEPTGTPTEPAEPEETPIGSESGAPSVSEEPGKDVPEAKKGKRRQPSRPSTSSRSNKAPKIQGLATQATAAWLNSK